MLAVRNVLSYADLSVLVGRSFAVVAGPELVLECVTAPWQWAGRRSYSLLLTGPAAQELVPGAYDLQAGETTLALRLEPVARDLRFVHYEAWVAEAVESDLLAAS